MSVNKKRLITLEYTKDYKKMEVSLRVINLNINVYTGQAKYAGRDGLNYGKFG